MFSLIAVENGLMKERIDVEGKVNGVEHLVQSENPIYIFDLDGTLANCEHRLYLAPECLDGKPDWNAFTMACGQDTPIHGAVRLAQDLATSGADIWIITGRSESAADLTLLWLDRHDIPVTNLIMRNRDYHAPGADFKEGIIDTGIIPQDRVIAVFEDQSSVAEMWRRKGFACFIAPRK